MKRILRKLLCPFSYIVAAFVLVCVMIISLVNAQLWLYLSDFEKSTAGNYMDQCLIKMQTGGVEAIVDILAVPTTEFTGRKDQVEYVKSILGEDTSKLRYYGGELIDGGYQYEFAVEGKEGIAVEVTEHKGSGLLPLSTYSLKGKPFPYSEITVFAPKNMGILVNGVEVSSKYLQAETRTVSEFEVIKDKSIIPTLVSYKVSGLLLNKTVESKEGRCTVKSVGDEFTISQQADDAVAAEIEEMAKKASVAYARFISNDGTFAEFTQYLQKDTVYYKSIVGFDTSWYVDHNGVKVADLSSGNTIKHTDELFSTDVLFTYQVSQGKKTHNYKNHYVISVMKKDGAYKIVNLLSI